jgi:hypothetical protein
MVRNTRKTKVFRRLYSPLKHAILAGKESIGAVANTAKNVSCDSLSGLNRIGSSVTRHANMAVNDLLGKRGRRTRRGKRNSTRRGKGKKAGRR